MASVFTVAHLSDLHLRDAADVAALERQLAQIAARSPQHLAITGDLIDRWDRPLLHGALAALDAHGFRDPQRLTILHGNHDLASSGGHPRARADLWRLALRFWDPPPLVRARLRRFYADLDEWCPGVAQPAPFAKDIGRAFRIAVVDSVPIPWKPLGISGLEVTVQHAIGGVGSGEIGWLARQKGETPLILLIHHYPLEVDRFSWRPDGWLRRIVRQVHVPMAIVPDDRDRLWRAIAAAGVRLVLCGHVHRARLDWNAGIAVGLNGQSGADWAGRSIAFYEVGEQVDMSIVNQNDQNR